MALERTVVVERDDRIYLVAPVAPFNPGEDELASLAFDPKTFAPNEHIGWLRGQYVEADRPNANGAMWQADDLTIKSLTPRLMPVTLMHDFQSNVGVIADTTLLTPEKDAVPRARIDTSLAIWKHRHSDLWEEVAHNYSAGSLMQSMECRPGYYDCGECGMRFIKLPGGAERENWCEHLRGETAAANGRPVRRLGDVTFTGSGLILGTRGKTGAFDEAHLDVLADEVAAFYEEGPESNRKNRKRPRRVMEIEDREYQQLLTAKARLDEIEPKLTAAEETAAKVPDLERNLEAEQIARKAAEDERDTLKKTADELAENERASTLAKTRTDKLGAGFKAKLPDAVKTRLEEQAKTLSDEDWQGRVDELAELTGVKPDEAGEAGEDQLSDDEIASSRAGSTGQRQRTDDNQPSTRSVVGGLLKVV